MHSGHIELAVANLLNYRVYTIVPNVSFGLGLNHECDMLALDTEGRFTEIEIKISASDLKADFKKAHGHQSKIISRLVYAMPEKMVDKYAHLIPKQCGIISVKEITFEDDIRLPIYKAQWFRQARHDKSKEKPSIGKQLLFMRLGCMRIWSLKSHNNRKHQIYKESQPLQK